MNNINFSINNISVYALIGLLILIILFPFNPNNIIPGKDSGAFIYMGQQILDGSVPYRDFWDHKGPVIYYINALGLSFGQGSMWGLWAIQLISLYIAGLFSYLITKKAFGNLSAIFATVLWLLSSLYVIRNGGNTTEEFSLPLSFLAIYLFLCLRESNRRLLYIFVIGLLFSISFLLRANNIAVELSILIYIIIASLFNGYIKKMLLDVLAFASGSIIILIAVLIYFNYNNALEAIIDQAFIYNFLYSNSSLEDKVHSLYNGFKILSPSGITIIAITAWIFGIIRILNKGIFENHANSLTKLAIIGLPLTLLLSILSGREYPHYYITWLPMLAILAGYFAFELRKTISDSSLVLYNKHLNLSTVLICTLLISMAIQPLLRVALEDGVNHLRVGKWGKFKNAISQHSKDENYMYMWGPQMSFFNFLFKKESPSKYFYLHPLLTCGYVNDSMIRDFTQDIKTKKPLIIETYTNKKYSIQIQGDKNDKKNIGFLRAKQSTCPNVEEYYDLNNFITSNYEIVAFHKYSEGNGWNIYKYKY